MSDAQDSKVVLSARGLVRDFRMAGQVLHVLRQADLDLHAGESVAIMGRSGAGKSTLLHLLGLLDRPDGGKLAIRGTETTGLGRRAWARLRNREVGFVFQFYHLIPELTALENVLVPLMIDHGSLAWLRARGEAHDQAAQMLDELGLAERLKHKPPQLSGGERQRVAIARALVSRPSLMLCDEPTGNLDERTSDVIADLLYELQERRGLTLVMVTHDADFAARSDRVLHLHDGVLHEEEPVDPAHDAPGHAHGQAHEASA